MYYFIGDIHGYFSKLTSLFSNLNGIITDKDTVIFLGDYIDRGDYSFEVVEFLISLSKKFDTCFLKGNHEEMLLNYLDGNDGNGVFLLNGGTSTINSYKQNCGEFKLPESHKEFYNNLKFYYEEKDFIAVHAGLNPSIEKLEDQDENDMIWIRDVFFGPKKMGENNNIWPYSINFHFKR